MTPRRLGMLIPSSNTVVEPETARLLAGDESLTTHIARLRVVTISDDAGSRGQFDHQAVVNAAELLADAKVDLILWNGTSAGWLGFAWDRDIVRAIETHTGIPATTAVMALNDELARLGARRIGLVTPYIAALEAQIIENYRGIGIDVVSAVRSDLTENTDYAAISPATIAEMVRSVARAPVDAVLILCTNLAGATIAEPLARELSVPVLDSVRVAVEHARRRIASGASALPS